MRRFVCPVVSVLFVPVLFGVSLIVGGWTARVPAAPQFASADSVEKSLAVVRAVDKGGEGHLEAQRAMQSLAAADVSALPKILRSFDGAGPLAANWLRNAFETLADQNVRLKRPLPVAEIETYVRGPSHDPRARRLAYEWLAKVDPTATARLIPGMLLDPAPELRRDAVALRMSEAAKVDAAHDKPRAVKLYREALAGALADDQVKSIAQALGKLGEKVDISKHFAFLTHYSVIGPFDNHGGRGWKPSIRPKRKSGWMRHTRARWGTSSGKRSIARGIMASSISPSRSSRTKGR